MTATIPSLCAPASASAQSYPVASKVIKSTSLGEATVAVTTTTTKMTALAPSKADPTALAERPRRVSFCDELCVKNIVSGIKDFTKTEIRSAWYCPAEFAKMRPKPKEASLLHKNCGKDCVRGLENRTRLGIERRHRNMLSAGFAVLEEQNSQKVHGVYDPDRIAQIYMRRVRHCQNAAFLRGLIDEQYIRVHVNPTMPRSAISLKAQEHPHWEVMDSCTCHEVRVEKNEGPEGPEDVDAPTLMQKSKIRVTLKTTKPPSGMFRNVVQRLRRNKGSPRSKAFVGCAKDNCENNDKKTLLGAYEDDSISLMRASV